MNQLALVTGSTAGIGYAIAENLYKNGFDVIINGRTESRVKSAIERISLLHDSLHSDHSSSFQGSKRTKLYGVSADITTAGGISRIFEQFPEIDVLVNNFGIFEPKNFSEISDDDWNKMWNANVMSGVRISRFYFPKMIKNNYGRVVFISSESGLQIPSEMVHYGVSKTAQIALARGMAEVAAGTNVTVNTVLVGPTKSEGVGTFLQQLADHNNISEKQVEDLFFKETRPTSLIKRFLKPEEIAAFVGFLCREEASAVTGAALRADGGLVKAII